MIVNHLRHQLHSGTKICSRLLHLQCGFSKQRTIVISRTLNANFTTRDFSRPNFPTSSILFCKKVQHFPVLNRNISNQPSKVLRNKAEKPPDNDADDLQAILKDKSLGITAKFKILLRQYGLVMVSVHAVTSVFWAGAFYFAVSRGFDILPFLENIGLFEFLERWGFSYTEKIKNSGASNYLMAYLIYELAKPIRYPVTLFGTVYVVRYLRRMGYFKPPPKSATVGQLVQTQGKIIQHRLNKTTTSYKDRYKKYRSNGRLKRNGDKRPINNHRKKS
uniref:DUF1279 domain-containing protein n=1 Tax=Ciona savignyi TaxID=51511 RepID=H2YRU6_CIOSA